MNEKVQFSVAILVPTHDFSSPRANRFYRICVSRRHAGRVRSFAPSSNQGGVALVVAMILLIVITLVGLAAVRGTILQQKMTSNFYDRELAFQASEAALRKAEAVVQATTPPGISATIRDCSPTATTVSKCLADPLTDPSPAVVGFVQPLLPADFNPGASSAGQPQYVIEYMGYFSIPSPKVKQLSGANGYGANPTTYAYFYRLTTRSSPATVQDRASVTLQTMYRR